MNACGLISKIDEFISNTQVNGTKMFLKRFSIKGSETTLSWSHETELRTEKHIGTDAVSASKPSRTSSMRLTSYKALTIKLYNVVNQNFQSSNMSISGYNLQSVIRPWRISRATNTKALGYR